MDGFVVPVYLLHPMALHFPIALLVAGLVVGVVAPWSRSPAWFRPAAEAMLWTGTLFLWVALGLGLLAEKVAPHVPRAWQVMASHERHAWFTAAAFSALSLGWAYARSLGLGWKWLLALWVLALTQLVTTAHLGAQLVYIFGVGSPQP